MITQRSGLHHIIYLAASVLPVLFTSSRADNLEYADCLTNFSVLEQAVLEVKDNRYNIIKAFYSPKSSYSAVYVKLTYVKYEYKFLPIYILILFLLDTFVWMMTI